jgi:hypothetical protein
MTTMDSFPNFSLDGLGLELGRYVPSRIPPFELCAPSVDGVFLSGSALGAPSPRAAARAPFRPRSPTDSNLPHPSSLRSGSMGGIDSVIPYDHWT